MLGAVILPGPTSLVAGGFSFGIANIKLPEAIIGSLGGLLHQASGESNCHFIVLDADTFPG